MTQSPEQTRYEGGEERVQTQFVRALERSGLSVADMRRVIKAKPTDVAAAVQQFRTTILLQNGQTPVPPEDCEETLQNLSKRIQALPPGTDTNRIEGMEQEVLHLARSAVGWEKPEARDALLRLKKAISEFEPPNQT